MEAEKLVEGVPGFLRHLVLCSVTSDLSCQFRFCSPPSSPSECQGLRVRTLTPAGRELCSAIHSFLRGSPLLRAKWRPLTKPSAVTTTNPNTGWRHREGPKGRGRPWGRVTTQKQRTALDKFPIFMGKLEGRLQSALRRATKTWVEKSHWLEEPGARAIRAHKKWLGKFKKSGCHRRGVLKSVYKMPKSLSNSRATHEWGSHQAAQLKLKILNWDFSYHHLQGKESLQFEFNQVNCLLK